MKKFYLSFLILSSFFLIGMSKAAAIPIGANLSNPINVGSFPRVAYTDTRNNSPSNGYLNNIGNSSDDIYYKITVTNAGELETSTCTSTFDTYIYILNSLGNIIASNDDNAICGGYLQASLKINVEPGDYYVVTEGYGSNTGNINVYINLIRNGATSQQPLDAGTLTSGSFFSDTKNNAPSNYFYNNFGNSSDDIYYKFTLTDGANVNVSHCASGFDTYMHILDVDNNVLASNDDYGPLCASSQSSISLNLAAGTYFIVSEGYSSNFGNITTEISVSGSFLSSPLSYQETNDQVIDDLDKTQIPTSILYDRVFPLAALYSYSGLITSDTSSYEHFLRGYEEMYEASYLKSQMLNPDALKNQVNAEMQNGNYPVGIMLYDFNYLDSMATENNQLYLNGGQLHDVIGRLSSPYIAQTTVVSAVLNRFAYTGATTFSFPSTYIYTNKNLTISSISANFDDGNGLVNINPGNTKTINYTAEGEKILKFTLVLSNGQTVYTNSIFPVIAQAPLAISAALATSVCNTIDSTTIIGRPFDASQYGEGIQSASIKIYYYYSTNNCSAKKITKPIVFLDGFDPTNKRDHNEIWAQFINKKDEFLGNKFLNDGYDTIILDYEDGGDFIEKNALAVVAAMENIYSQHSATIQEDFVVIGPSMGGPIARYALAWAQQHNINLHTRTYISFDGVHQGANIPIGLQSFAAMLTKTKYAKDINNPENNPLICKAAKQMLIDHYLSDSEVPTPHDFFNILQGNLSSIGYPTNCRNVALINGSFNNNQSGYNPTQKAFDFKVDAPWPLGEYMRAAIFHAPSNGRSMVSRFFLNNTISKLAGLPREYQKFTNPYTSGYSYDVIPGGMSTTYKQIQDGVNEGLNSHYPFGDFPFTYKLGELWGINILGWIPISRRRFKINALSEGHSFVPTTSSIDFIYDNNSQRTLSYDWSNENIVCTGRTPFDRVYSPGYRNEEHVAINSQNAVWFENEIKGTISPQPGGIGNVFISGPSQIVCSPSETYTISNLPAGSTINWSTIGDIEIIGSTTGNSVSVSSLNQSNWGQLTATIQPPCSTLISLVINKGIDTVIPIGSCEVLNENSMVCVIRKGRSCTWGLFL